MQLTGKKGQVAIWVIVAIVIVAAVVIFLVYPQGKLGIGVDAQSDPKAYLASCLEQEVKNQIKQIALQGGSLQPEGFIVFNDTKIQYLCYTSEYFKPCTVQQPNVQNSFEQSMAKNLRPAAEECVAALAKELESEGISVNKGRVALNVSFVPNKANIEVLVPLTVSKEITRTYQKFEIGIGTEMYQLLAIASSILDFESTYGDSEITAYARYYPQITVNKNKLADGTKIYTITDVQSKDTLQFASRGIVWPVGYGATA